MQRYQEMWWKLFKYCFFNVFVETSLTISLIFRSTQTYGVSTELMCTPSTVYTNITTLQIKESKSGESFLQIYFTVKVMNKNLISVESETCIFDCINGLQRWFEIKKILDVFYSTNPYVCTTFFGTCFIQQILVFR